MALYSPYTQQQEQVQSHFPAIPRTLHLYKTGLTHRNLQILDTDKRTYLYEIHIHSWSSPDISLYRPAAGAIPPTAQAGRNTNPNPPTFCGSATLHTFSRTIDLQIGNREGGRPIIIPLRRNGIFSNTHKFKSCVGELSWKGLSLLNANEELLATFTSVSMAVSKWGRFELTPRVAEGGQRLVDEIVLSGLALLEERRRKDRRRKRGHNGLTASGGASSGAIC